MKDLAITSFMACDPDTCPLVETCPKGPIPNLPCPLKEMFSETINDGIANTFIEIEKNPETSLRVNILLKPLFDQLLLLRIEQMSIRGAYRGAKVNPIFGELRKTMAAIQLILDGAIKSHKEEIKTVDGALGAVTGTGYYEMLCYDGENSVEKRVGPE